MTTFQKVIKYLAIAFAIFLIINIVTGVLALIGGLAGVLHLTKSNKQDLGYLQEITSNIQNSDIGTLKIQLQYSNLKIQKGDTFKAQSDSTNISCTQNNNQIVISEKKHKWFSNKEPNELIVYIPQDMIFEGVKIQTVAGEIYIYELNAKDLSLEMGAGKVNIESLNVFNKAEIEGGAGQIIISSSEINDLELEMGVGEAIINSKLTGKSEINAGVGNINIDLTDEISNYTIKADKGLGSIKIDGREADDDTQYGNGESYIKIDGGVGNIDIK